MEGEAFTLTCVARVVEGLVPSPLLTWKSPEGSVVNSASGTQLDLILDPLGADDKGIYSCDVLITVSNTCIMNSRLVNITTEGKKS